MPSCRNTVVDGPPAAIAGTQSIAPATAGAREPIQAPHGEATLLLEPRHELVEAQLLEALADRVELGGAELDQAAALAAELERLAQAGLAGVQPGMIASRRAVAAS